MQKPENPRKESWSPSRHALRVNASKRFNAEQEKDLPRTPKRRGTGYSSKWSSQLDRDQTVSGIRPEDILGKGGYDGHELSQPLESSDATDGKSNEQADVKSPMRVWRGVNWQEMKKSDSISSPLASPFTLPSPGKEQPLARGLSRHSSLIKTRIPRPTSRTDRSGPGQGSSSQAKDHADHGLQLQHSKSVTIESSHDEDFPKPRLASVLNRGDNILGPINDINRSAESGPKGRDSIHGSECQPPRSGDAIPHEDGIIRKDFDSGNQQRSDPSPLPKFPQADRTIDKTSNSDNETVSDKGKKADETGTLSETPPSSHRNERDSLESQPQSSASEPKQINPSFIQDLVEGQRDPETSEPKDAPDIWLTTRTRENVGHESRPRSPRSDHIKKPDPQDQGKSPDIPIPSTSYSPSTMESKSECIRSSEMKGPDPKTRSPDPRGVIIQTDPTQDQAGEDVDSAARLDSDAPFPGNNKSLSRDIQLAESHSPNRSGSSVDSLIVAPTKTVRYPYSQEVELLSNAEH